MTQSRWSETNDRSPQAKSNYRDLLAEATLQIRRLRSRLDNAEYKKNEPIAIVGMSCRFPGGANTPEAYWDLLKNGIDAVTEIPNQRWNVYGYYDADADKSGKMYTRYGSFVDDVDQFDPQFFGISPREARSLDPQQRLLLETSYTALENAGLPPFDLQGSATGVFIGLCFDDYAQRSVRSGDLSRIDAFSSLGNTRSIAAGRIAYLFGFQGPTMQLDTTCSSSLLAVHLACQSLRSGESNLALAGGVNLMLSPEVTVGFCKLKALSPDGRCKTFDISADGYGRGEGCGVVVLKRLSDAIANQDNILALVKGSAVNHDGVSNGLTAPNGSAQTAVIRQAVSNAQLSPEQIQYVEAHGTGTSLGDPIELLALDRALGSGRSTPLLVGSVKTNFGHLESAAGVAGLMKVILSLQHKQIPPHLHLETPNPYVPWGRLAIDIPRELTPWPETEEPRRAGLSGFGMSGTNVHLIIEEAEDDLAAGSVALEDFPDRPQQVLALSAQSDAALKELAQCYKSWLPTTTETLANICFTANTGRSHFSYRVALVAANKEELIQQLENFLAKGSSQPCSAQPKVAFLFTGQGAQYVGMGQQLYETEPVFRSALNRCADILETEGIDLLGLLFPESRTGETRLHRTAYSQPALLAIAHALTELWKSWGIQPDCVLGHSIGEYAAAHTAGVIGLEEGLKLVAARGRLMQALPAGGGMAAVMAAKEQIAPLLPAGVEIAAINSPENTVISGELTALEAVVERLENQGFRVKQLQVSHAFHSAQMEPMLEELKQFARSVDYCEADIEIVSSITGEPLASNVDWSVYWSAQIRQPVQFAAAIKTLANEGCDLFIEIGPKPTLIAMGQTCLPALTATWLPSLSPKKQSDPAPDWQTLLTSLGKLYEAGGTIDWAGVDRSYPRQTVQIPNYPFQRDRYWIEAEDSLPARAAWKNQQAKEDRPLLGRSLSLAGDRIRGFESQLQIDRPLNWADHQILGSALLPAAAYLEIGLAAGKEIFKDSYSLKDISFIQGLWLKQTAAAQLQTLVTKQELNSHAFEIHSLNADTSEAVWTNHVSGQIESAPLENIAILEIANIQKRLTNTFSASQFYEQCAQRGIDYGDSFRAVEQVWYQPVSEALAQVKSPIENAAEFVMHPVLLDAGLQLSGATLAANNKSYLPVFVEKFSCYQPIPDGKLWIHAQRRSEPIDGSKVIVDISWLSEQGQTLAKMEGLVLQSVDLKQLLGKPESDSKTQWLHQISWQQQPLLQNPAEFLLSPEKTQERLAPSFSTLIQQSDFRISQSLQPELNQLAIAYIQQSLITMGWSGESLNARNLADTLQVVPAHRQLFSRCIALLVEADLSTTLDPQQVYQQLNECSQINPELALLSRCGDRLSEVFQGHIDPLTLLFPEGDLTDLTKLYQSSVGSQVMNQLVQESVLTAAHQTSTNQPLRILEIGAGTGGTTARLLPQLANLLHPISYLFTDISSRFTNAAKARFEDFGFMDYALLNIEHSPQSQGFAADFDIAIAANVLHATADLQSTLSNVSNLLAPGGQLILLEGTQPVGWIDLIFGLTPGWWKFTDTALRANHPLISVGEWRSLLKSVGFEKAVSLQPENTAENIAQSVVIAQQTKAVEKTWGLLGAASKENSVASCLAEKGQIVRECSQVEDFQGDAIVCNFAEESRTSMIDSTGLVCRQALELIQTVAKLPHSPRLYFISTNPTPETQLAHSGLWGLLQTSQLEHLELRCTYIQAENAEQIVAELLADSPETQVIYREGQRQVARIEDYQVATSRLESEPTQLFASPSKTLSDLSWQSVSRRPPNADEVEIRIYATGLNFRDVLIAMGAYPEAAPLGCECVGEVVAVGSDRSGLQIGQRVMAIAPRSFAQYVTIHRDLVASVPEGLTTAEAATLPVAFTTAYYSLCQAQIKAGDRVLIHSAAGGVGQAAVQIAQQIGAEIFATASPSKWDALRSLGITHIMNSRTLAFADEIMAATNGEGVDVVLSALPGEFRKKSLQSLSAQGRFVEIGKGEGLTVEQIARIWPGIDHFTVDLSALCEAKPQQVQTMLCHLGQEVSAGNWRSLPYKTFSKSKTVQAFRTLQQANRIGKVVLTQDEDANNRSVEFRADGTYLITGGFGGLGLVMAKWMGDRGARRIVLLGRQEPTLTAQAAIEQLEAKGIVVNIVLADVTDRAAMTNVFSEIEQPLYPLKGIIHAAGVLDDWLLQRLSWDKFERVLAPKVAGAWNLHDLTQNFDLDCFVLFSSAAALFGSPGQANHATANAFLDGLARYRQQQGRPALSINWGAWSAVGSALGYQQRGSLEQFAGVGIIAPEEGLDWLEKVWVQAAAQVGIVPIDWADFLKGGLVEGRAFFEAVRLGVDELGFGRSQPNLRGVFIERLAAAAPEEKGQLLDDFVCDRICQTLGFALSVLDRQAGFFDLGMDSLTALELKNSLQTDLGISLPSTLAFDYPTVEALLTYLAAQLIGDNEIESSTGEPLAAIRQAKGNAQESSDSLLNDDLMAQMDRKLADIDSWLGEDV